MISRKITEGGCAEIYEGTDIDTKRKVAVKVLHARHLNNKAEQKRMLNEGALGMRMRHCPYLVETLKMGKIGERPYIIFEYIPGMTLRELIREYKMLTNSEVVQIAGAVGRAVRHMHQAGFYHKDIKPDNIMLDGKGTIKLIDLGFAETFSSVKFSFFGRTLEGSPAYMAPELIRTKKPSMSTDIYGLGCSLFEAATGHTPFPADSDQQVLEKQCDMALRPGAIVDENPDISPFTQKMILTALEKNADYRHKSADEFLLDLARNPLTQQSDRFALPQGRWMRNAR
ncbi:MAG: serine/threonine protein kinase [Planctomycetota bacterium]|nr:serine/threonine protein kinase [Planctomycetota bacterium]